MAKPSYKFGDDLDEPTNPRHYEAFGSQDKLVAIEFIRSAKVSRCPSYSYLFDISFGRLHYNSFMLFFTFMTVKVTGENLKEVVDAIKLRKCSYIQEFHPDLFDRPQEGKPLIKKIEVTLKSLTEAMAESENND